MNKLEVKIPFWYKPFIRFMPNFYRDVPKYDDDAIYFKIRVDELRNSFVYPIRYGKEVGKYSNNHLAYLKVRWKALWKDFWTFGSGNGINWVIIKKRCKVICSI